MSENEKHYYLDMLSFCKVIFFSFYGILILCVSMLITSCLNELGMISFAVGLDSKAYLLTLVSLIIYSITSIRFSMRKIKQFKAMNLT